ncbi:uncharacterized protein si:ch211-175m2.4 isoform X2 [Triplophysa rosa]|uniref:uncharacterized protein si:ch211-175m2.4 isoform X2 n=1 Tax=Triplophysa rosa TaxID=992332 RepID=UPI002545D4D5|nr:uncharacterized protein si:ch211-175m2.4 isoform X2 [Triplophysa rosa]
MIAYPVYQERPYEVSVFLKTKPQIFAVKTAQALTYINMVVLAISFHYHLVFALVWGVIGIVLMVCDVLVLIFSIVIASASCSCCCRPKSRSVAVSYMSATVPVNSVGLLNHSDPSASPQPVTSVVYVLPATYGQVPSLPPPNYGLVTPALSANYSLVPTAPPANYNVVPTSPPPAYDQASVFSLPEFQTQENQIHQYMK